MLPANNDFKALPPKVSSSSSAFAKNNNPQFHQQQNVNGQLLQKPTKIPSKEAFTFHHQPPAQVPESTIEIMAQQIEQILMEDREKLKAQFDVHLANIEVQYKEKIIQLENSSNLQKASIFSLQTQNKMLIEQLEKCKQEMSSKEIEQQNELTAKTSLIKGLQNVVKLVSDQLTEARKTEASNVQKAAELEQEMELKNPTISSNADTTICGRPSTSSSSLMLGIGSRAEPEQSALATSFNQIGRVKEEPVADDVNMEEADQQKQRPPSSAAKNDNDKNGGGQNNA